MTEYYILPYNDPTNNFIGFYCVLPSGSILKQDYGKNRLMPFKLNGPNISNGIIGLVKTGFELRMTIYSTLILGFGMDYKIAKDQTPQFSYKQLSDQVFSTAAKLNTQRELFQTGNQLDLALLGQGFYQLQLGNGTIGYTREGVFSVNNNRRITNTASGFPLFVIDGDGIIPFNATGIIVNTSGLIQYSMVEGINNFINAGQIQLANFINQGELLLLLENDVYTTTGTPFVGIPETNNLASIAQFFIGIVPVITPLITSVSSFTISTEDAMDTYVKPGIVLYDTLFYAIMGISQTKIKFNAPRVSDNVLTDYGNISKTQTLSGTILGLGIEKMLGKNYNGYAEVTKTTFDTAKVKTRPSNFQGRPFTLTSNIDNIAVSFGLRYRF